MTMRTTKKQRDDLLTWWSGVPVERYQMVLDDFNELLAAADAWRTLAEMAEALATLRADGWTVAVHNDYRLHDEPHTFWLFTRDGRAIKGEGRTDVEALRIVLAASTVAAKEST